ncbi:MAG: hypothetical protein ACOX6E_00135 [Syntrophomonadaceae bacterium]|jgi:hypothetical protein
MLDDIDDIKVVSQIVNSNNTNINKNKIKPTPNNAGNCTFPGLRICQ